MKIKVIFSSVLGNALEFYDFTLCGVFIPVLARVYFPGSDPTISLFLSLFAFSAAFWTRPLGAYYFGRMGDRKGRKKALTLTLSLMGVPTLIIGVLPGYESWGMAAPIILILCRVAQGLFTGGEYNGAALFALEHHFDQKPGLVSGLISASCVVGALSATFMAYWTTGEGMPEYAWRFPFLLGAIISLLGFYLRRTSSETEEFSRLRKTVSNPLSSVWKNHRSSFLLSIASGAYNGVLSYTLFGFLNLYLSRYAGYNFATSIYANLFGLLTFMVTCIISGNLADRWGIFSVIRSSFVLTFLIAPLAFVLLLTQKLEFVVMGQMLLGTLVGAYVGPSHFFMKILFPVESRYTGVALGFTLGMALTGGSTPGILTAGIELTGQTLLPAFYLMGWAFMSLFFLSVWIPSKIVDELENEEVDDENYPLRKIAGK